MEIHHNISHSYYSHCIYIPANATLFLYALLNPIIFALRFIYFFKVMFTLFSD